MRTLLPSIGLAALVLLSACDTSGLGEDGARALRLDSSSVQRLPMPAPTFSSGPRRYSLEISGSEALFGLTRFEHTTGRWLERETLDPAQYILHIATDGVRALATVEYWDSATQTIVHEGRLFEASPDASYETVRVASATGVSERVIAAPAGVIARATVEAPWSPVEWERPNTSTWIEAVLEDGTLIARDPRAPAVLLVYRVSGGELAFVQELTTDLGSVASIAGTGARLVAVGRNGGEVYDAQGGTYGLTGSWSHSPPSRNQQYGWDVEVHGDVVAVGAPAILPGGTGVPIPDDTGSVFLYALVEGSWETVGQLDREDWISDPTHRRFGESVALGDGRLVFGNSEEVIALSWTLE